MLGIGSKVCKLKSILCTWEAKYTDSDGKKDLYFQYQGISRILLCRKGSMPNFVAMTSFSLLAKLWSLTLIIVLRIFYSLSHLSLSVSMCVCVCFVVLFYFYFCSWRDSLSSKRLVLAKIISLHPCQADYKGCTFRSVWFHTFFWTPLTLPVLIKTLSHIHTEFQRVNLKTIVLLEVDSCHRHH